MIALGPSAVPYPYETVFSIGHGIIWNFEDSGSFSSSLNSDPKNGEYQYFMGGSSCLTADCFGEYKFEKELKSGDRVAFLDQAHYTMVKTNTFNGVPLPSIALWNSKTDDLSIIKKFGYEEFENRLS